jgi:hypothetical protein
MENPHYCPEWFVFSLVVTPVAVELPEELISAVDKVDHHNRILINGISKKNSTRLSASQKENTAGFLTLPGASLQGLQ